MNKVEARIAELSRKEARYREIGEYLIADELAKMILKLKGGEGK
jgi:hypothetical protein